MKGLLFLMAVLVPLSGNPLAPEWIAGEARPNPRDWAFTYATPYLTLSGPVPIELKDQVLQLDRDSDFWLRWFGFATKPGSTVKLGDLAIRYRDDHGRLLMQDYVLIQDIVGPVFPPLRYRSGSPLLYDLLYQGAPLGAAVAATPVLIDGTNAQMHQDQRILQNTNFFGNSAQAQMFTLAGRLYAMLSESVITSHGRCFMSANNGATWTAQDITHEPGSDGNLVNSEVRVFYPGTGTKFFVEWIIQPVALQQHTMFNSFDAATNLWGTESPQGPLNVGTGASFVQLAVLSTGDAYVFQSGPSNNVVYLKFSGGVWAGAVTAVTSVVANVTGRPKLALVDSTNTMHLIYQETNSVSNLSTLFYVQVSSTGVVGAPVALVAGTVAGQPFNVGYGGFWQSNVVVPFQSQADNVTKVLVGTPVSAPVFSTQTVDPGASTVPVGQIAVMPCALVAGATLSIFWGTTSAGDLHDKIWMAANAGSGFGSPSVFYDNFAFPVPQQDPGNPGLNTISSPTTLPNGGTGMLWDAADLAGIGGTPAFFLPGGSGALLLQLQFKGWKQALVRSRRARKQERPTRRRARA